MGRILQLRFLAAFKGAATLFLRILTGSFLVWGVWDNVISRERMVEFEGFLAQFGFPLVEVMAPLSVYTQLIAGLGLILGLLTRWAGALIVANFIVAVVMVHINDDFRGMWPALVLVAIGAYFMTNGGGRIALDRLLRLDR